MKYIQVRDPDPAELKRQIGLVKGKNTMAEFAERIKRTSPNVKTSAASLSRAWNGTGPPNFELLQGIAAIAPPDCGVTLESLATAAGMRSIEEDEDLTKRDAYARRREYAENIEHTVQMIIQSEIANRSYSSYKLDELMNWKSLHGYQLQRDRVFPRNYTFGFSVSGMTPCNVWKFALNQIQLPKGAESATEAHVGNFINKVGSVFASDSFEYELYENEKYSFVFVDPEIYRLFLKRINDHDMLVNGLMTAILIDLDRETVVEETQLKRSDGETAASFFKTPVSRPAEDLGLGDPLLMVDEL